MLKPLYFGAKYKTRSLCILNFMTHRTTRRTTKMLLLRKKSELLCVMLVERVFCFLAWFFLSIVLLIALAVKPTCLNINCKIFWSFIIYVIMLFHLIVVLAMFVDRCLHIIFYKRMKTYILIFQVMTYVKYCSGINLYIYEFACNWE